MAPSTLELVEQEYGRIINIGSVTCVSGDAGLGPYCASSGGTKQLTMSLADGWGLYGITVNCLAPGWFKTGQNAVMYEDEEWGWSCRDNAVVPLHGRGPVSGAVTPRVT
ncbi:MAG: SDR family NAD(P)-dependent oxidoreductase [Akkermansiaceae bacterium]|nr:SDR family NAD(P)-dependent oxidoreductase [Akkermansiaceae bacterium]